MLAVWARYWPNTGQCKLQRCLLIYCIYCFIMFLICTCVYFSAYMVAKRNKLIIMAMQCWSYGPGTGPILASVNCNAVY